MVRGCRTNLKRSKPRSAPAVSSMAPCAARRLGRGRPEWTCLPLPSTESGTPPTGAAPGCCASQGRSCASRSHDGRSCAARVTMFPLHTLVRLKQEELHVSWSFPPPNSKSQAFMCYVFITHHKECLNLDDCS